MANPVQEGTLGSRPFVNEFVDVVHEELNIKVDKDFNYAQFQVRYHINSLADGVKIPFLFYASEYYDSFTIKIDGKEIGTQKVPEEYQYPEGTKFKDFTHFFGPGDTNYASGKVELRESDQLAFTVRLRDMIYFETDISKGEHTIDVSYIATKWTDGWGLINEYSFRYALSPASYWKSFGILDVILDATECSKPLNANIDAPHKGNIDSIAYWRFDNLPVHILQINYSPKLSKWALALKRIGTTGFASIITGLLVLLHGLVIYRYWRKKRSKWNYGLIMVGCLLVPLGFVLSYMFYYEIMDYLIGEHASSRGRYTFISLFLYPFITAVYGLLIWLLNRWQKNRMKAQA